MKRGQRSKMSFVYSGLTCWDVLLLEPGAQRGAELQSEQASWDFLLGM